MLTFQEITAALGEALEVSKHQGNRAVAIVKRDAPRGWWDRWNKKPYAVELMRPELDPTTIIVGGISADLVKQ